MTFLYFSRYFLDLWKPPYGRNTLQKHFWPRWLVACACCWCRFRCCVVSPPYRRPDIFRFSEWRVAIWWPRWCLQKWMQVWVSVPCLAVYGIVLGCMACLGVFGWLFWLVKKMRIWKMGPALWSWTLWGIVHLLIRGKCKRSGTWTLVPLVAWTSRRPQNSFATPAPTIPAVHIVESRFLDSYWKNILARECPWQGMPQRAHKPLPQ